jgi:hypothetical protein
MRNYLLAWARRRAPDFVIGCQDDPYLLRCIVCHRYLTKSASPTKVQGGHAVRVLPGQMKLPMLEGVQA